MKAGWRTKRLGELCSIELGKTPARADKAFWDEQKETTNVWLSIADLLNTEGNLVTDSKEYLSNKGAAISKIVRKGTLLVSFKLTLGRLAYAGRDLYTNEAIAALSLFDERELSKEFLFYFLHFFDWQKAAENDIKLKGMTLNKAKLREIEVTFPPLAEQRRIVAILDEAFEGIATARANAERNLRNARELFENHLQAVFTERGEGWVVKKLGDVATLQRGFDLPTQERVSGEVPLVSSSGVIDTHHVSAVRGPGVVTGRSGSIGNVFFVEQDFWPLNTALYVKNFHGNDPRFICYLLKSFDLKRFASGTGVPTLNRNFVHDELVGVPALSEQRHIVATLDDLSAETQRLEASYQQKVEALDELRKSLLHRAFQGEL